MTPIAPGASAIDVINPLAAAKSARRLKQELKKYTKPTLLILDELGYLPIDKAGADLLFQVISLGYEQGAMIITSNRAFKEWPKIFNNDSTLTAAMPDRLLHHADTVVIEGKNFRMRGKIEPQISLDRVPSEVSIGNPGDTRTHLVALAFSNRQFFNIFTQSVTPSAPRCLLMSSRLQQTWC